MGFKFRKSGGNEKQPDKTSLTCTKLLNCVSTPNTVWMNFKLGFDRIGSDRGLLCAGLWSFAAPLNVICFNLRGICNISSTTCLLVHVVTPSTDTIMPKPSINSIFGIFSISNWVNFNICALHRQLMNECRKNLQFIALDAHFQFALIQIQIQRIQNTVSHLYVVLLGMNWIRVVRFQRWKIFQENSFDHFFLICSIFLWNFFPSYCQWWQLASSRLEANNAAKTK